MFIKCILLLFVLDYINASDYFSSYSSRSNCPMPMIANGNVRVRQKSKLARFSCSYRYTLVGNRYTICKNGKWDEPLPVCVRSGCSPLPHVSNSVNLGSHDYAWVVFFCLPGYSLVGSPVLYCDGSRWNSTVPSCVVDPESSAEAKLSCDFEDGNLCGWSHDELHDFDWIRLNRKTPSAFLQTGPSYDHTLGKGFSGYYMYIESTSRLENSTARLLSPVFEEHLTSNGCFSFYYHMWGKAIGGLRVYQKPDNIDLMTMLNLADNEKQKYILFEQWGNQGNVWYGSVTPLRNFSDNFQIVIEGIRGKSFTSDIAIDDVAILQGDNCTLAKSIAPTPTPFIAESCVGRCDIHDEVVRKGGCGCYINCFTDGDCCADFLEICMFDNSRPSDDDTFVNGTAHPQTEKLVAVTTVATTLSTTPSTTSTTTTSTTSTTTTTAKPSTSAVKKVTVTQRSRTMTPKTTTDSSYVVTRAINNNTYNEMISKKNLEEQIEASKLLRPDKKKESSHSHSGSGARTATITMACLCVIACGVYLAVWMRGSRARETLARLRGAVRRDPEVVRYLNADVDDD